MNTVLTEIHEQLIEETDPEKIRGLSFQILEQYCLLNKQKRSDSGNRDAVCAAAKKFTDFITQKSSGKVWRILHHNRERLPQQAVDDLELSIKFVKAIA